MTMIKCYSDLIHIPTFEERFKYLKLDGIVGNETFGFDRYLNQMLYVTKEWRSCRREIIIRDNGCDIGIEGHEIYGKILIHHMNPVSKQDILNKNPKVFDPEHLIVTSFNTHNAIHYGDVNLLTIKIVERSINDTRLW